MQRQDTEIKEYKSGRDSPEIGLSRGRLVYSGEIWAV